MTVERFWYSGAWRTKEQIEKKRISVRERQKRDWQDPDKKKKLIQSIKKWRKKENAGKNADADYYRKNRETILAKEKYKYRDSVPTFGLRDSISQFRRGEIGFDELNRRYDEAIKRTDEIISKTCKK